MKYVRGKFFPVNPPVHKQRQQQQHPESDILVPVTQWGQSPLYTGTQIPSPTTYPPTRIDSFCLLSIFFHIKLT